MFSNPFFIRIVNKLSKCVKGIGAKVFYKQFDLLRPILAACFLPCFFLPFLIIKISFRYKKS